MGDWNFESPPECLPEEMDPLYEEDAANDNEVYSFSLKSGCIQQVHYA